MEPNFREAKLDDLPSLIAMLADDHLGATREDPSDPPNPAYIQAFEAIDQSPLNHLVVAEAEGEIVGTMQVTYIPNLSFIGSTRCLIEGVRVHSNYRGHGLGGKLIRYAIEQAREKQCLMVQLTSNKQRPDAIRFYENLGFKATHEGFKLLL